MQKLTSQEMERYHRHLLLPQVDRHGQEKLKNASVLVVGVGGLGSPIAMYLTAAGVGRIGLIDADTVSLSNLQRQIIHTEKTIGQLKVDSARERLQEINSSVQAEIYPQKFSSQTNSLLKEYDVIIDATDNFSARYAINAACVREGKPMIYGAVHHFDGQYSVFAPHLDGPCYQCVFPNAPEDTGEEIGVFGVLPGIIGSLQAAEAIKLIIGIGKPLLGNLAAYNALENEWYTIQLERNPDCPICSYS